MAPFLLLPPGVDILHAHLTLRTAHRRRTWQIKRELLSPGPAERTRDGDGVHCNRCSPAPRTHTLTYTHRHRYKYRYERERSLVECTISTRDSGPSRRSILGANACTRSREASQRAYDPRDVILISLSRRRINISGKVELRGMEEERREKRL